MKSGRRRGERNSSAQVESSTRTELSYWKSRLLLRRYLFPASGQSEKDLAAFIEHAGVGYFFPLGTPDANTAAARALEIYQVAVKDGWKTACQLYSRELILSFEWCLNPLLWTYTTIHTLVGEPKPAEAAPAGNAAGRNCILVAEPDPGILRALCWCINQEHGFVSVPCDSPEAFNRALVSHKPRIALLNRSLAGRLGLKSPGELVALRPGVPGITYSAHVDGDQMFVSTPGGAAGYLATRVRPEQLLEPILHAASRSEPGGEDLVMRVKYYFQGLLQLRSSRDKSALARLTNREREVLELMCKGCVDKEIAQAMRISAWTVHGYIKKIFRLLHVRTRTEAVVRYLEK